jgi:hypothetical protein
VSNAVYLVQPFDDVFTSGSVIDQLEDFRRGQVQKMDSIVPAVVDKKLIVKQVAAKSST